MNVNKACMTFQTNSFKTNLFHKITNNYLNTYTVILLLKLMSFNFYRERLILVSILRKIREIYLKNLRIFCNDFAMLTLI